MGTALRFSTKGGTLESLSARLPSGTVLPLFRFEVSRYLSQKKEIIQKLQSQFQDPLLIIRSSALGEDGLQSSFAGSYKTIPRVPRQDSDRLQKAVEEVIASYGTPPHAGNEVLVQPMLEDIASAGVVFTADLDTLSPYFTVNYDETGSSDAVTAGRKNKLKTFVYFKDAPDPCPHPGLAKLFDTCRNIETLFDNPYLDIEFAFTRSGRLVILQARPIVTHQKENLSGLRYGALLGKIRDRVAQSAAPHPDLLGKKTLYGVMPDWNPAEIIGLRPRRLAISTYKELITDSIWAYQRDNYGYRNLRSHPLLISFAGMPFIDIRVDFNSFIPKNLDDRIAEKLVDHYLTKLENQPVLHDKVEFEIVHSCYYIGLYQKLEGLLDDGFNANELKRIEYALLELTNNIIDTREGLYRKDLAKIEILKHKFQHIADSKLPLLEKIYWHVENCKRFGTLPFAGIARSAFIGVQFLRSLVSASIFTDDDHDRFMASLTTVNKKLGLAFAALSSGKISREAFLREFGHLRPGTYDILSPRYDENFEGYFSLISQDPPAHQAFVLSPGQSRRLTQSLAENGIKIGASELMTFIRESIEGREEAKFIFTKSLSEILRLVRELGKEFHLEPEELSHLDIHTLLGQYGVLDHRGLAEHLRSDIERNRESYQYTKAVKLPVLIKDPASVYGFTLDEEQPNFVTLKRIRAETRLEKDLDRYSPEARIVFIKSSDPGYDFLFTKNIAGLITQFGGANSHMAIRCAELGVPAVIGAGEKNFNEWATAKKLDLDCANRQVVCL